MAYMFYTNIRDKLDECKIGEYRKMIDYNKLKRIDSFQSEFDYLGSMLGEVIVKIKVGEIKKTDPAQIQVFNNKYGKPSIQNFTNIHYNISHSGDWVVCLLSDKKCGIDIEKIEEACFDIADAYFSDYERDYIYKTAENQNEKFFELWTLKESYIKFAGKGLFMPLKNVIFYKDNNEWKIESYGKFDSKMPYFKHNYILKEYIISTCTYETDIVSKRIYL